MTQAPNFLVEEFKSLKEEIRLRQCQIVEIEKSIILLMAGIVSVIFITYPRNGAIDNDVAIVLSILGVFGTCMGVTKVTQNIVRILQIHEYITKIEAIIYTGAGSRFDEMGYERHIRPKKAETNRIIKIIIQTNFVNFAEIAILLLAIAGSVIIFIMRLR